MLQKCKLLEPQDDAPAFSLYKSVKMGRGLLQAVSHHQALAPLFLEHMVGILDQVHVYGDDEVDKGESSERSPLPNSTKELPQAATLALGAIFR